MGGIIIAEEVAMKKEREVLVSYSYSKVAFHWK